MLSESDDPRVAEFIRAHPIDASRLRDIEAGKARLEREVARMIERDRDPDADPSRTPLPMRLFSARLAERMPLFLDRLRQRREEARASFTGDCLACRDDGPCGVCDRGREAIEQIKRIARQERIRGWRERVAMPRRGAEWSFASIPLLADAHTDTQAFVREWDGREWLLLHGDYGTGKTGLLIAALNHLAERMSEDGRSARFVTTTDLYASFRDAIGGAPVPDYVSPDLLVIDDLGSARQTEWETERLFAIVNARHDAQRATWVTTNLSPDDLALHITPRVFWRLFENCRVIEVRGANLRTL